ncbi:triose-phosphate isomerase [Duganella sp. BuS-21]|uniref:triose-phosphate isomerase n=1 Tax=Duganella sp. BuS-21 TaxID=2943848 RepID=UPI0035A70DE8
MTRKLIVGNWKMNGNRESIKALLAEIVAADCEATVCVPHPYLALCAHLVAGSNIRLGGQDLSAHTAGAYTGEVSAAMLQEFGCAYVLVGHSERRVYHAESDAVIAGKTQRAVDAGLIPIVCIGETLHERQSGQTEAVLARQLQALPFAELGNIIIAYEPIWAIGSGASASPEVAQHAHAMIRSRVDAATKILYGGSVTASNAASLLAMPDIDGALIGGASLHAKDFLQIAQMGQRRAA